MDKFKIQEIAIDMAADDGLEYDDLSPGRQMSYYKKAYEDYLDGLADRADMMRKGEADGGIMRKGYAVGTNEDDIPEMEDIPSDEYRDLLKQIGAPVENQASGIRSLDKKMASDDVSDRELERLYEKLLDQGMSPEEAAKAAKELLERMYMSKNKKKSIKLAESTDPLLLEEYEKYVFEMLEQGLQPMSLREFEAEARAGVKGGGLLSIM